MSGLRIVLDTNCLLQILGARSKYHFLSGEFLAGSHFDDAANSPFPSFRIVGLDEFAEMIKNNV